MPGQKQGRTGQALGGSPRAWSRAPRADIASKLRPPSPLFPPQTPGNLKGGLISVGRITYPGWEPRTPRNTLCTPKKAPPFRIISSAIRPDPSPSNDSTVPVLILVLEFSLY